MFSHRHVFGQDNEDGANPVSIETPEVAILDIEASQMVLRISVWP